MAKKTLERLRFAAYSMCAQQNSLLLLLLNPIHIADADTPTQLNCRVELRRRRRCVLNSQLTTIADENLETEHVENLSCRVELCRRCVRTRRLLWLSLQFCSHWDRSMTWHVTHDTARCVFVNIGEICATSSFAFGKIVCNRRKQKKRVAAIVTSVTQACTFCKKSPTVLSATQYTPPTQLNSTVELRRRRRCVLGFRHTAHCSMPT